MYGGAQSASSAFMAAFSSAVTVLTGGRGPGGAVLHLQGFELFPGEMFFEVFLELWVHVVSYFVRTGDFDNRS